MSDHAHGTPIPASSGLKQPYHLVDPSPWPLVGALGGALVVVGIILAAHFNSYVTLVIGSLIVFTTMFFWWRDVIRESRTPGLHSPVVRLGLRYGMMFFIASEVMFFVAFFWAFFNYALFPDNVSGLANPVWPPPNIHTYDPFHIPILNTMILLLSGTTITWAHHALIERDKRSLVMGLGFTILLGMSFTACQVLEDLMPRSSSWAAACTPGVLPGHRLPWLSCHRRHVLLDRLLVPRAGRAVQPQRHFGFEAAASFWHFVDVVWLFLFVCLLLGRQPCCRRLLRSPRSGRPP